MFIKIGSRYIAVDKIVCIEDSPRNQNGKITVYVWGLRNPLHTDDYVSIDSLMQKIMKIKKSGVNS